MQFIAQRECQLRRIRPKHGALLSDVDRTQFVRIFLVPREWGRIGTIGRVRVDLFETEHAALAALDAIERIKRKRGYRDMGAMSDGQYS
jgi:hypothetical protein